jgi:hypothetical protein
MPLFAYVEGEGDDEGPKRHLIILEFKRVFCLDLFFYFYNVYI